MKLTDAQTENKVRITDLDNVNDLVRRRLMDLGIMEGSVICLKKSLPFGGPLTIESKHQLISIRRKEALQVQVEAV